MRRLLPAFILFSSICNAQDFTQPIIATHQKVPATKDSLPFFVSLNAGMGFPTEDFGSSNKAPATNEILGYANNGSHYNMTVGIHMSNNLALACKVGFDMNSINIATRSVSFIDAQSSGDFQIWQFMGGLYYDVALSKNSYLWVQAMAGDINANYPSFTSSSYNLTSISSFQNGNGIGYTFGIGFERAFGKTFGLVGSVSYSSSVIKYPSYTITYSGVVQSNFTNVYMDLGSIQTTLGICIHW